MALDGSSWLQKRLTVRDPSHVGEVRREVETQARAAGFDETQRGRAAIVATELATNIVRHTRGGEILIRRVAAANGLAIEVLAIDGGPGMADPARCLRDGYSTRGTPGNGLGAIMRQSEEFDLHSSVEKGTVIVTRMWSRTTEAGGMQAALQFGGVCLPYPGEVVSGDAWRIHWGDRGYALMIADGLGHGVSANAASEAATEAFDADPFCPPAACLERIHQRLKHTRGGTVAVANYDARREQLSYSGIGNIAGRLLSGSGSKGMISVNGVAGGNVGRIQQFEYECRADTTLVMHSDGLQGRWDPGDLPGILARHPAILAGALYRDYQRGRDDVSVVAARWVTPKAGARGDG